VYVIPWIILMLIGIIEFWLQQWLHRHITMLHYTCSACLISSEKFRNIMQISNLNKHMQRWGSTYASVSWHKKKYCLHYVCSVYFLMVSWTCLINCINSSWCCFWSWVFSTAAAPPPIRSLVLILYPEVDYSELIK